MPLRSLVVPLVAALFLLGALTPLAVSGQTGSAVAGDNILRIADPVGDAGPLGLGVPGGLAPANPLFDHVDIVEVRLGPETVDSIGFGITFNGWDDTISGTMATASLGGVQCWAQLYYEGMSDVIYQLSIRSQGLNTGEPHFTWYLHYSYWPSTGGSGQYDRSDPFDAAWDGDTATVSFTIPKNHIPVFPGARNAAAGDILILSYLDCRSDIAGYGSYADYLDERGIQYPLRSSGAGGTVQVQIGSAESGPTGPGQWTFPEDTGTQTVSVAAGRQAIIPVHLTNLASERKLTLLSAVPTSGAAPGWNLSIAPSVLLNGEEERTVNLIVTPPAGVASGTVIDAQVIATVAAEESIGRAPIRFEVAPILSAAQNTLHFHARERPSGLPGPVDDLAPMFDFRISLNENEPGWDAEVFAASLLGWTRVTGRLPPIAQKVDLSADEPATFTAQVVGDGDVRVELHVETETHGRLYQHQAYHPAGTHQIAMHPYFGEDLELPFGTRIIVTMVVGLESGTTTGGLDLKGSHLRLPIEDSATGLTITDGTYLPNLGIARGEDRVAYLNPGRTYTYDLRLANDGLETDDLTLSATATNATGWSIEVVPGATFRVPAGNATPLGVAVRAAPDAQEGDIVEIDVKAISKHDPLATASLKLRAIVTTGIDLPDRWYEARDDQMDPLVESEESPMAPLFWVTAVLIGGLVWGRRRRH